MFTKPPHLENVSTIVVEFERAPLIVNEIETRPTFLSSTIPEVVPIHHQPMDMVYISMKTIQALVQCQTRLSLGWLS